MPREDRPVARRRLIAAGVLMAIAAIVVLVVSSTGGGDGDPVKVPEAGSRFREQDADQSLLDVLGPVLIAGAGNRADQLNQPLDRAVAALFVVGYEGQRPSPRVVRRFRSRGWGALLVEGPNVTSAASLRGAVRSIERAARGGRQRRPMVVADALDLPPSLAPRSPVEVGQETPEEAFDDARDAARRLRAAGVRAVLAPSADLAASGGPAEARSFGDDPERIDGIVRAAVNGWRAGRVAPIPGRFPGEGAASQDPLAGPATVGLALPELMTRDLKPFGAAVPSAPAIQMSAALYAAFDAVTPASLLPAAIRLLRERLRYDRAILSADLLAVTAATGTPVGVAAIEAIKAGCDLLLLPGGRAEQEEAFREVLAAARRGDIPRPRLAEALRRTGELRRAAGVG